MKKELIAAVMLLVLFSAALVNIHFLGKLTGEIKVKLEEAETYIVKGDWERAKECAEKASQKWGASDAYTHMVLRHSEIEAAGDSLSELLKEIYAENAGAAEGAAKAAAKRMNSIANIEKIKLGSIF